jgi:hypothetical protein
MRMLAVFLALAICVASAFAVEINIQGVKTTILPNETAEYRLIIENDGQATEDIRLVFSDNPAWSVITDPIYHQASISLPPGAVTTTTIYLTPDSSVISGQQYNHPLLIDSNTGDYSTSVFLAVFLRSPYEPRDYVPNVRMDVDIDRKMDPRNEGEITVNIENLVPRKIDNMVLIVESTLYPALNSQTEASLDPFELKSVYIPFKYDALQAPANDTIAVSVEIPSWNQTGHELFFDAVSKGIEIVAYNNIIKDTKEDKEFLKSRSDISIFNDGNAMATVEHRVGTSLLGQMFTDTNPPARVVNADGERSLAWSIELPAQGRTNVTVIRNYRPLFVVTIAIIVAVLLYFFFRSPLVVRKQAKHVPSEGEASRLKILLHVRNRSSKLVENVTVSDKVPGIAKLDIDFPVGTMQPAEVLKDEKRGTHVKWVIPTLEAYEERIITYYIESKLRIVGAIKLPETIVHYKSKLGKISKVTSGHTSAE